MEVKAINSILNNIPDEKRRFVRISMFIAEQISIYLEEKSGSKSDLANELGCTENELDNMLDGTYNFDIKTLAKIESFFKSDILTTPNQTNSNTEIKIDNFVISEKKLYNNRAFWNNRRAFGKRPYSIEHKYRSTSNSSVII